MRRAAAIALVFLAAAVSTFVLWPDARPLVPTAAPAPAISFDALQASAIDDSTFAALVSGLSEQSSYFDTDNLISNESSYLHVMDGLRTGDVVGGAYLGVGPDQNFSYMAVIRPRIAFILDIRRDNLLQHLMLKALFELSPTRIEYLSLLFGRTPPGDPESWSSQPIDQLIDYIDGVPAYADDAANARRRLVEHVRTLGVPLSDDDLAKISVIHTTFVNAGPDLRYSSHGRAPRPSYPTYRRLLLATDRTGDRANFLATEDGYAFLRAMQLNNLVVPVVGDFAGPHALRAIAEWLTGSGLTVSAFYLSNVEFYLWQDGTFDRFADNVAALPFDDRTVMIRSLFGGVYGHPLSVPGYNSTQLMQDMAGFVRGYAAGEYETYGDLIFEGYIGR
jgi:hypothetical protein